MKEILDFFKCFIFKKKTDIHMKKLLSLQLALKNREFIFFFFLSFTVRRHMKKCYLYGGVE